MSAFRRVGASLAIAMAAVASGCELREVSLTEPEHAVVAEAYVEVSHRQPLGLPPGESATPSNSISVFLHQTLSAAGTTGEVPGARIVVTRVSDGLTIHPSEVSTLGTCLISRPVEGSGTCYSPVFGGAALARLAPGDRLSLRIELAGGGVLTGETEIPGKFDLIGIEEATACVLAPQTATDIVWSRSSGAWAYISDTFVSGLALRFGRDKVADPLYLWGLSVSAADTTIAFPREFGLFSRTELDRDVSLALQQGLPDDVSAIVTVAAVDRNWVNWARGGNFNPSGQVRVPSVRGDGTGVFGSAVVRAFRVVSEATPAPGTARCPPASPSPPSR